MGCTRFGERWDASAADLIVEAAYQAESPRRRGRIWVALDAHQLPYWGRDRLEQVRKGWSGTHSRRLRGYRLYLAVDCDSGQIITFALLRGDARDRDLLEEANIGASEAVVTVTNDDEVNIMAAKTPAPSGVVSAYQAEMFMPRAALARK